MFTKILRSLIPSKRTTDTLDIDRDPFPRPDFSTYRDEGARLPPRPDEESIMSQMMNTSVAQAPGHEQFMAIIEFRRGLSREEVALLVGIIEQTAQEEEVLRVRVISHPTSRKPRIVFD